MLTAAGSATIQTLTFHANAFNKGHSVNREMWLNNTLQALLLSQCNNDYANAPHCYVTGTMPFPYSWDPMMNSFVFTTRRH